MKASQVTTFIAVIFSLGLLTGCPSGPEETVTRPAPDAEEETTTTPEAAEETTESQAEAESEGEPVTITITGNDAMQFDTTEFSVKAGQQVTIAFQNVGTLPKEAMGHNVVVLQQETEAIDFATAGAGHAGNDYIDPEREDEVIAATPILGPGEEESISFTAPAETGDYNYLCTFPGHAQAGMVGVMTVE